MGIGDWGLGPIPNPQSPIPNPQSPIPIYFLCLYNLNNYLLFKKLIKFYPKINNHFELKYKLMKLLVFIKIKPKK